MEMERLEKLDQIRERTGVSYGEADAALARAEGDVVKAIIDLEERTHHTSMGGGVREEFWVRGNEMVDKVKEIIKKGNVTRVIVKSEDGRTLVEIPMTVGLVGTVIAPYAAILGGLAAIVTRCKIIIEHPEPTEEHAYAFGVDPNNEEVD